MVPASGLTGSFPKTEFSLLTLSTWSPSTEDSHLEQSHLPFPGGGCEDLEAWTPGPPGTTQKDHPVQCSSQSGWQRSGCGCNRTWLYSLPTPLGFALPQSRSQSSPRGSFLNPKVGLRASFLGNLFMTPFFWLWSPHLSVKLSWRNSCLAPSPLLECIKKLPTNNEHKIIFVTYIKAFFLL